ncbi:MAG: Asp-tRNA(Asn)/Glu-tRNA(Gln) amidotransferase subunit GatA [Myxococcota bacterium]
MHEQTLHALRRGLDTGEITSVEATKACLARLEATRALGTALYVDADGALKQAEDADSLRRAGHTASNALDGVPVALKDIFMTEDLPTTCGSKILEGFLAPYDGTAVARLKDAGAILVAKLSMDEFAMGSSSEHCAFGPVRNPWNAEYVPGGSSGGSAVAVATGAAFGALGTDTGGSIRQPAAFCGVVGLKPTYGRVSRYGVIAFASSLDQVGPLSKDVTDCALLLQIVAGHDPRDSTSAEADVPDYLESLEKGVDGLRLGVPKEYFVDGVDADVRAAVQEALDTYRKLGAEVIEVSLPHTEYAVATYYLIATAEASSNLARYDGVRYGQRQDSGQGLADMYRATRGAGFGAEVKRRIMLGTYALSAGYYDAYYLRAQKVRTLIRRDFTVAFEKVDALVTPTTPTTAFRLGENLDDPIKMYLADIFTVSCNLAGLPGLSLPCGVGDNGLPIGLQLIGRPWEEATILRLARAYERETEWHTRRPPA